MARTLTDRCADKLRSEILGGKLNLSNGFLTESRLCKRFGVSRITIRRCLALLCDENLLLNVPYKGYVLGPAAHAHKGLSARAKASQPDQIVFVQSPESGPIRHSQHMRRIWDGAKEESAARSLRFELCRLPLHSLIRQLTAQDRDHLLGVALEWYDRGVAEALLAEGIPTVLVEYHHESLLQDSVTQDNVEGTNKAVDHLWGQGHRRLGMIAWGQGQATYHSITRRAAFVGRLLQHGLVEPCRIGVSDRFDAEGGREAARQLLALDDPPTGILIAHLEMAAGVFEELDARNLKVGKDVSVVAWGTEQTQLEGLDGTRWRDMPIDLVSWSREEMGRMVVRMLLARFQDPMIPPMRIKIPTTLQIRASKTT